MTVGDEKSALSNYGPVYSYYKNSFSEVVYLSSELQAGTIISISYQYAASEQLLDPAPTIYMAEVSRTAFSSSTDWETTTMTQVYSGGSVTYSQGWVTIFLTTPFEYSGTGNLVVAYNSQRDHYFGYRYFTHTSTTGSRTLMHYDDYDAVSGYNCTYSGTTYNQIPNTRFVILGEGEEYCFPATGLAAQNILSDEATLTWNISDASSTTFGLDYKLSSEEEWTTASTSITDTFYTLTALTSLTNYDFRVYAICSEENSDYSSGTFLTPPTENDCLPIPTTETFDDSENMTTWITMSNSPNNWYIGTAENSSTGDDVYNLTFDWKCMGSVEGTSLYGGLVVLLQNQSDPMPTDGNYPDEDDIVAMLYGENAWTNAQIELPQVSGEKRLVFFTFGYLFNAEATAPAAIDNISITASTCPAPQNANVTNITTNSAEISWEGTATSYVVSYRKVSETTSTDVTVSASPYTLTNLDDATEYIVAVKGICGTDESIYSDAVRFSTYQNSESVPYTCGFDEEGTNGWLLKNGSCTNQWYVANGQMFISQDNGATAGYDADATSVIVAEKLFDTGTSDSLTISFDLNIGGESSYDYLKVYWVDADTNYTASTSMPYYAYSSYATNILVSTHSYYPIINLLSGTQTLSVTIPNVANSMKKLVFVWKNDGSDGTQPGAVIDNVSIQQVWAGEQPDPCDAPTALAVNNITQTSADFSWSGTASSYEVRLNGAAAETVTTTSKSFTNLTANTTYTAEVRAMCENNNSAWVSTTFTTLEAEPVIVPPTVATLEATEVTYSAATLNGIVAAGSEEISAQGFMYKAAAAAEWTSVSAIGETMTATISGLTAETSYEYKAFATTESGTVEGEVMSFTTLANSGLNTAEGAVATMTVYPNPASERAIVAVSGVESGAKIVVSDMQGRIILTDTMAADTYELSVENLASGVYYIRVIDGASIHTQKLIVK